MGPSSGDSERDSTRLFLPPPLRLLHLFETIQSRYSYFQNEDGRIQHVGAGLPSLIHAGSSRAHSESRVSETGCMRGGRVHAGGAQAKGGPRSAVRSWARKRHDRNTDDGSQRVSDRARPGRPAGDRPARRLTKLLIHLPGTHAAGWFPTSRKRDANRKDAEASGTAPLHARPCAQAFRKKPSTLREQNHRASRPRAAAGREAPRG